MNLYNIIIQEIEIIELSHQNIKINKDNIKLFLKKCLK